MAHVSIIIPTLNESDSLAQTLRSLTVLDPIPSEVIIVDGGSSDRTLEIAQQICVDFPIPTQILKCDQGRSIQMNQGAKQATRSQEAMCTPASQTGAEARIYLIQAVKIVPEVGVRNTLERVEVRANIVTNEGLKEGRCRKRGNSKLDDVIGARCSH